MASAAMITTAGTIASSEPVALKDVKDVYFADLRVNPGNSGGPVFDYDGNLAGVCLAYTSIGVKFMEDPQEEVTLSVNGRARKLAYNAGIAHVMLSSHLAKLLETVKGNSGR